MRNTFIPGLLAVTWLAHATMAAPFDFNALRAQAQALAAQPYRPEEKPMPESLARLSYVEHRAIEFDRAHSLWREEKLPFQLEYFHPGYIRQELVTIHELERGKVRTIPFQTNLFHYGTAKVEVPADLGFAGFRIVHPVKDFGEVAVFKGASYFRMIGKGQTYGSSARGLALNTTRPGGEEFPVFRQFWVEQPAKADKEVTVYALLDSPSVAGAYRFDIRPGSNTHACVKAALFPRAEVREFGLAALTSMFVHGKNGRPLFTDFRPEVHDSDGLLMHNSRDEWIWHPFEAGKMMRVNAFQDENPRGFGLIQRERNYEQYQDAVAKFECRPSVWITPVGKWGRGAVQLVQIPSDREFTDNIVAFWVPAETPKPGSALDLEYDMEWTLVEPSTPELGRVRATRIGQVIVEPVTGPPNRRFVVDFDGPAMDRLSAREQLAVKIEHGDDVKLVADSLFKVAENGNWRLVIEIADPRKAVDLRATLLRAGKPISETWTFTWQP